jgi:hypothetical protein
MSGNHIRLDTTGGRGGELSCVLLPERVILQSKTQRLRSLNGTRRYFCSVSSRLYRVAKRLRSCG